MCINCMLCYAACPEYGLEPKFIGPAAIALAHRYNLDSRDAGARSVRSHRPTTACGDAPSSAPARRLSQARRSGGRLQQVKVASTLDWFKEHLLPGGTK